MIFTELAYLPLVVFSLIIFALLKNSQRGRLYLIIVASAVFYCWWSPKYYPLMFASIFLDYTVGIMLSKNNNTFFRKILLTFSICGNLGILALFKYSNFFVTNIDASLSILGLPEFFGKTYSIILPVGISFYTFQSMSYTFDVYLGNIKPCRDFVKFTAFVTFFPQLVAGPILRAKEFLPQLDKVEILETSSKGVFRILYGIAKKMWLADLLGLYFVDPIFENPLAHRGLEMWFAVYAYAFQIFLDFSAYSDIAIGTALTFILLKPALLLIASFLVHDFAEPNIIKIDSFCNSLSAPLRGAIVYLWILCAVFMWEAQIGHAAFIYFQF